MKTNLNSKFLAVMLSALLISPWIGERRSSLAQDLLIYRAILNNLLALSALATDVGRAFVEKTDPQMSEDAAALQGVALNAIEFIQLRIDSAIREVEPFVNGTSSTVNVHVIQRYDTQIKARTTGGEWQNYITRVILRSEDQEAVTAMVAEMNQLTRDINLMLSEEPEDCFDRIDNDGDRLADCDDPDCCTSCNRVCP